MNKTYSQKLHRNSFENDPQKRRSGQISITADSQNANRLDSIKKVTKRPNHSPISAEFTLNNSHKLMKRSSSETSVAHHDNSLSVDLETLKTIDNKSIGDCNRLVKSKSTRDLVENKENAINNRIRQYVKNNNFIKIYNIIPQHLAPPLHITNQDEVRKNFLEEKIPPVLKFKADDTFIQGMLSNKNKAKYDHFFKAKHILDTIKNKYPNGVYSYYEANFGKRIKGDECLEIIGQYLADNKIDGEISINFAPGLTCAGRIYYHSMINNRPETRKFVIWISNDADNQFLREKGLICLCDHEMGTHYYRSYNDGLQPWFADRKKFGLRGLDTPELMATEEGLAACHTLINANMKFLYLPALFYYLVCMAEKMTFEQLFNHMEHYVDLPEERWKLVTRVKRGISDPHAIGCYTRDQCYFEGAVDILENLNNIDFNLLMTGKICLDELPLIRKCAKVNTTKLKQPKFMRDLRTYKRQLREIGIVNGIIEPPPNPTDKSSKRSDKTVFPSLVREESMEISTVATTSMMANESKTVALQQIEDLMYENNIQLDNLKEYREMFEKNNKLRTMTSLEIKKFIMTEIVANAKNQSKIGGANNSLKVLEKNGGLANSNLCTLI